MNKKGVSWLYSQIPDLVSKNIITEETGQSLTKYYGPVEPEDRMQTILTIFGVLGAVFVGLGIISMIAYNWSDLPRVVKTILSFAPLLIGQAICLFVILKKYDSVAWREASSVFLMTTIGASISLVSQTYHISGDFGTFILTWLLLGMPLAYIMQSRLIAIFYIIGLTIWSAFTTANTMLFWPLLVLIIPFYYKSIKEDAYSNGSLFLSWAIAICCSINMLINIESMRSGAWVFTLSSFFTSLYLIGSLFFTEKHPFFMKPFQIVGLFGIIVLSFIFTYEFSWSNNYYDDLLRNNEVDTFWNKENYSYILQYILPVIATGLTALAIKKKHKYDILLAAITFLSLLCYFLPIGTLEIDIYQLISMVIFNIYVLVLGIIAISQGTKENDIGRVNIGMLIISLLICLRFFDIDVSFLVRGFVFIVIGISFFAVNYMLAKKMKGVKSEK